MREELPRLPIVASLTCGQRDRLSEYAQLLAEMNRRINLVSREDEERIASIHIPHVLAMAYQTFPDGSSIVDWGTGGGLPAIPLAIAFPQVQVHAVDAVEKKTLAVRTMARRLGLKNLNVWAGKADVWPGHAEYSVSRATAPLSELWKWHRRIGKPAQAEESSWRPGLICLKGGDLTNEIEDLRGGSVLEEDLEVKTIPIHDWYEAPYFESKYIVHVYDTSR